MRKNNNASMSGSIVLSLIMVSFLTGCNGGGSDNNSKQSINPTTSRPHIDSPSATPLQPDLEFSDSFENETKATYTATLVPLNRRVVGERMTATFTLTKNNDEISAQMKVSGSPVGITHAQRIYSGVSCPTEIADENRDGFVDTLEGEKFYQEILIPLDGDLNSQESQFAWDALADQYGTYVYSRTASFKKMLYDLKRKDRFPNDNVAKLKSNEKLELQGRVVVIHGVNESLNLPASVASRNGLNNYETLPIACGIITKVNSDLDADVNAVPAGSETVGGSDGSDDGYAAGFEDSSFGHLAR